jgi:hypothetical protein
LSSNHFQYALAIDGSAIDARVTCFGQQEFPVVLADPLA